MKSRANLIKNKNLQLIKTNLKLLIKKFLILLTAMIMAIMMAGRNLFESAGRNCKLARWASESEILTQNAPSPKTTTGYYSAGSLMKLLESR